MYTNQPKCKCRKNHTEANIHYASKQEPMLKEAQAKVSQQQQIKTSKSQDAKAPKTSNSGHGLDQVSPRGVDTTWILRENTPNDIYLVQGEGNDLIKKVTAQ